MKTNELSRKECTDRRAHWEAFSFGVCPNGIVNVQNNSYGDDSKNHIYSVDPVAGRELVTNGCSCTVATYRDGPCKHQVAVRNNAAIMLAVEKAQDEDENESVSVKATRTPAPCGHTAVATDGGTTSAEIIAAPDDSGLQEILGGDGDESEVDETEDEATDIPGSVCTHPDCETELTGDIDVPMAWPECCSALCGARYDRDHDDGAGNTHSIVCEAFVHEPVLAFNVFHTVIDCTNSTVSRLAVSASEGSA